MPAMTMSTRPVCSEGSICAKAISCHSTLDAELLGDRLAELDVEAHQLVGRRVLVGDRRVVRLRRDDELAGLLDAVRQACAGDGERGEPASKRRSER